MEFECASGIELHEVDGFTYFGVAFRNRFARVCDGRSDQIASGDSKLLRDVA